MSKKKTPLISTQPTAPSLEPLKQEPTQEPTPEPQPLEADAAPSSPSPDEELKAIDDAPVYADNNPDDVDNDPEEEQETKAEAEPTFEERLKQKAKAQLEAAKAESEANAEANRKFLEKPQKRLLEEA